MSVEVVQKVAAVTLIAGSLGGGYFALTGGSSGTLKGMHLAQKRQLVTDWDSIEAEYNKDDNSETIDGITKKGKKVKENIKQWCETKGSTYYLGSTDNTYRLYAVWCLQEVTLDAELTRQGFRWDTGYWGKKLKKYTDGAQSFIKDGGKAVAAKDLTEKHIEDWCNKNKGERYKYQGDTNEYQVRGYCYWTDEELAEAKKPEPDPKSSPSPPGSSD
ncbi:hypothetical protein A6V39_03330 [Candidatus Mycoplasma haematobovis]|uniref:Uncharacterized protein n=1 Tax=Candidatus Mycoplasma haematobovis TaxID=432608 RepID=A0A1A9QBS2_9MOLU|nr:hypothetical protein [Candidatus Mycoplasma haematobovis]OAL09917.1 hypothetical protein A6V39_03330 [Candidatus Mycoplasma haematobovis]